MEDALSSQIVASAESTSTLTRPGSNSAEAFESKKLLSLILDSLDEDGALDTVTIDLGGKSSEADTMVIASGRSTRHVSAVSEKLIDRLKAAGTLPRAEGQAQADWVLIDAGDVIVHLFRPEVRDFYQLEKMWMPQPDRTARPASAI